MKTTAFAEYRLSQLMLGTVQFGMPYGIANTKGQPSYGDVRAILACAYEGGVNCLDTAAAYGQSEDIIGRALEELGLADRMIVVTKVPAIPADCGSRSAVARFVKDAVTRSLQRLRMDVLPICLFHIEGDSRHLDVLHDLKDQGLIRHVGVSCDNRPGPAAGFVAAGNVSALQLPGNILDRRHQRSGVFRDAAARGVAVFIRSVYLQGLLVMPEDSIPPALREIVPVRRRLAAIAGEGGMTLAELALRYMLTQAGVTGVLTGVETVAQIRENMAFFNRSPLAPDMLEVINAAVPDLAEPLITPALWPALSGLVQGAQILTIPK